MRQSAAAWVCDGMAGSAGIGELGNDVEKISGGNGTRGKIPKDGIRHFAGAGAVAAQAILVLIDGRIHGGHAIGSVNSGNAIL